jgi:hypothetical protein
VANVEEMKMQQGNADVKAAETRQERMEARMSLNHEKMEAFL